MKHRTLFVVGLAVVTVLSLATTAATGKPDGLRKPTTSTQAPPDYWSCQARVDNGATGWILPDGDDPYTVSGLAACIDISAEDLGTREWTVVWQGRTRRDVVRGLDLVFEEQVHGTVYAERVFASRAGVWCPSFAEDVAPDNLVFVAMPHTGDRWIDFEIAVTPGHVVNVCPEG